MTIRERLQELAESPLMRVTRSPLRERVIRSGRPRPGGGAVALLDYSLGSFVRASEAAIQDPRAAWAFEGASYAVANELRTLADGAILLEPSRTNRVYNSEAQDGSQWIGGPSAGTTITEDGGGTAPDGGVDADLLSFALGGVAKVNQRASVITSLTHALSVYARAHAPSEVGKEARLRWGVANNTSSRHWGKVEATLAADWGRFFGVSAPGVGGLTDANLRWDHGLNSPETGDLALPAVDFDVWGHQIEQGGYSTSYIRALTAATTRQADRLTIAAADVPAGFLSGTWTVNLWPLHDSTDTDTHYIFYFDASNFLAITAGTVTLRVGGTSFAVSSLSYSALDQIGITVEHGSGLAVTGGGGGTIGATGDWSAVGADLRVGWDGTSNHLAGVLSAPLG